MLKLPTLFAKSAIVLLLLPHMAMASDTLPANLQAVMAKTATPSSAMAILVRPVDGGPAVLEHASTVAMSPASTMKLLTTVIALEELGPTYRWKTQFLSAANIKKDRLRGDLYLRGGGAPDVSWDRLALMLRSLRDSGIREIGGNIVLDRSHFQPSRFDLGLAPFDETPDAYYNVIPDALMVESNLTQFAIESDARRFKVRLSPPMANMRLDNQLKLIDAPCDQWETKWQAPVAHTSRTYKTTIKLSGDFPRHCKITTALNTLDRNVYIEQLIRRLWQEMGGTWRGHVLDGQVVENAKVLVERQSDTLADNIKLVNKRSDNMMARLLYLSLGTNFVDAKNYSTSFLAAEAHVRQWFEQHQISHEGLVVDNGSGLSRSERISAQQMASLLQVAAGSNWFPELSSSLPIVAVDGTMRRRLKGSAAEARARIKTGTLRDAVAVAGYVRDVHNRWWIVVAMVNQAQASQSRPVLDEVINWVANGAVPN
jgi:D-alanyl-D-alanine carboxypeptidase/D-alanyl-D-alanine-endopeptidase (penicillin-binding protein 4)